MNEKQAREIYKPFEAYKQFPIAFMKVGNIDYAQILEAKGYLEGLETGRREATLEALDKAKGLEEFIKTCCDCDGEHTVVCDACQALAKYRSVK